MTQVMSMHVPAFCEISWVLQITRACYYAEGYAIVRSMKPENMQPHDYPRKYNR